YGRGPSGTAICTNRPAVFNDISTDHGLAPWREDALKRGYASVIGLPLIINSDSIGVITICAGEFDAFHDDEVKLLTELSNDLAYGIAALRIRKEHQHFEEALQESEEKFKSAFNYAAIGKALVGIDGRWLQVNKALCNIVGYSEQELLSRTFQDITYPDDLDADLGYVRKMLAGEIQTYQMEKRYFHKLGHIIWVLLSVSVVCDQDENPLYFISQIQDISARKRAEEQLRIYRDNLEKTVKDRTADLEHTAEELKLQKNEAYISKFQAEAATRAKSDFLANMSHELRTPLNSVIGFSEILQDEMYGTLNEKQKEYLSDILSSGQHLLNLINDILDLSKVEAGKMELELSRFTLSDVLNTAMTMLKEKAIKHMIRLNLEIQPDAVMEIEADERKLKQIMFNLMSNAVKFTLDGGSVHVHARKVRSQEVGVKKKSPNSELNTPNTTEIS
ncbi:MAG: PAS domain S-box protein, partial [Thermodesulfovibrionales bacterium]|nr:PAS domain S-box protein [Thermodesulfovibrionales bacterium]